MWCQQFWLQRAWRKQSTKSQVGGGEEETGIELENTFFCVSQCCPTKGEGIFSCKIPECVPPNG